jgi:hypothetical protein
MASIPEEVRHCYIDSKLTDCTEKDVDKFIDLQSCIYNCETVGNKCFQDAIIQPTDYQPSILAGFKPIPDKYFKKNDGNRKYITRKEFQRRC